MANATVRRTVALLASLLGGYLLYVAANPGSTPSTAFWSFVAGLVLFIAILFFLQLFIEPLESAFS